jgi:hypothetical protein
MPAQHRNGCRLTHAPKKAEAGEGPTLRWTGEAGVAGAADGPLTLGGDLFDHHPGQAGVTPSLFALLPQILFLSKQ